MYGHSMSVNCYTRLVYGHYLNLGFTPLDDPNQFHFLLKRASSVLYSATRNFYKFNDFKQDYQWRKNAYIMAICAQIEFFDEIGGVTHEAINSEPQSQQIGRTRITNVSRFNPAGANQERSILAVDAVMHLEGTGLLWRGGLR